MPKITTNFTCKNPNDELLTGTEQYRIIGDLLSDDLCRKIMQSCAGLSRHWHCLEKAIKVKQFLPNGYVVVGKTLVASSDLKSTYGCEYVPPYEFHAWYQCEGGIIDIALPGLIEKGLSTSDEHGPFLVDVNPVILACDFKKVYGLYYEPREIYG